MKCLSILLLSCLSILAYGQDKIQYFKSFDKTKIAYTDEGKGEPVVLIHGFISSGSSWNNTVLKQALLDQGYRVIVPDLRGNGKSDKPQKARAYAKDAEVKDLNRLADHLKLKSYTAIGYSRGSIVLAKLLTKDKRIGKAVLGGMGLDFTNPDWPRRIQFADAFSGRAALTTETEGAVNYAKSVGADIKVLGYLQDHQPVTAVKDLKKVETHILVIAGGDDHDNGSPLELKEALPNSELNIIPGDHNNTWKGQVFSDSIVDFLNRK
ncbi:MAG: alpha/beta hydrolase [Roseivirga sp.]|nr:alpha/beta hydrolase [Roseivirga sp.]